MYVLMRHPEYGTVHKVRILPMLDSTSDTEQYYLSHTTACGKSTERLVRPRAPYATKVADCLVCNPELRDPHKYAPQRKLLPRWQRDRLLAKGV
jgi:hypothetical protein